MKPIVFVAMPFGKKKDLDTGIEFDFNDFYNKVFKPLNDDPELGLDFVREDLVDTRGIIQKTMIEKLLLAEFVIADLSFANPNVYYELGIRHCAKKYTTFLIFSDKQLKFDVAPLRAISYKIENGLISDEEVISLQKILKEQLLVAKNKFEDDSPVYELLPSLNIELNITPEDTKSFKERALWLNRKIDEVNNIKNCYCKENHKESIEELKKITLELDTCNQANLVLWCQIISCLKDLEQYEYLIELLKQFPQDIFSKSLKLHQDLAFALNRLGKHIEAQTLLKSCLINFGDDSETYGLLGRTYKDLFKKEQNELQKEAFLDKAIEMYTKGLIHDLHNFYTGINAAQLLLLKNNQSAITEMNDILTTVYFSLKAIPENKKDFWAYASYINCLILKNKQEEALTQLNNLYKFNANKWMFETTVEDFERTLHLLQIKSFDTKILEEIIKQLHSKIETLAVS